MDLKVLADWMMANGSSLLTGIAVFTAVALLFSSSIFKRAIKGFEEALFTNWRLVILGTTGGVLSLVAGYTTFDGLRNFTGGGTLSLAATFGIQGVMLVTAWLIGESFASGMSQQVEQVRRAGIPRNVQAATGAGIGILLFVTMMVLFMQSTGQVDVRQAPSSGIAWSKVGDKLLIVVVGLLIAALVALYSASDLVKPYLQGGRVIIRNSILWVMFLACMSVSVFFSFDSHFSGIFPQSERVRAAELRAQNQVSGILADIRSTISDGQIHETEALFQSQGWQAYETQLVNLSKASQGAEREIEAYFVQQMEARRQAIAQQQERIATSQSSQAGLFSKKATLTDELARLKGERPALAADLSEKKSELDNRSKAIDAKRVEAMAEDKGVEGTGKAGKGPVYRERMSELGKMQEFVKIQDDRVKDATKRLNTVDTRIAQLERELAAIDGDIAKLKGEAQTAESRIKLAEETKAGEEGGPKVDPARVRATFEKARAEFRQEPTTERLAALHGQCAQLYGAMIATPATKDKVRGLDCDPKQASEAAAQVFALNSGVKTFEAQCAGGDKLNQHKSTDALFGFAKKCLADSGLASKDTDTLRTKINFIELNRDDKAHRFVVTWNAFLDGNRLAYLALAIAITIDSLVFMSGLFGANSVRSPLSDVPSLKARSGKQLEAIIDTALIPHKFDTARHVLGAMRPMTQRDGYMARVIIDDHDPHAGELRRVLNAGTTIGAVRHTDGNDNVYEIRSELFEYLSYVAKKEFDANREHVSLAELERTISVALTPNVSSNAELVLSYIHPMSFPRSIWETFGWQKDHGFMGEVRLAEVIAHDLEQGRNDVRMMRNALNAGAIYDRVQRAGDSADNFFIHGDFYKTLVRMRARLMLSASDRAQIAARPGPLQGGSLNAQAALPGQQHAPELPPADPHHRLAPPQAAQVPHPGIHNPGAHKETVNYVDALRYDMREQLIMAAGLYPTAYNDLARNRVIGAATGAAHAIGALASRAPELAAQVDKELAEFKVGLDDGYFRLKGESDDNPRYVEVLDATYGEVFQLLPALMLMPNGPYERILDQLIADLEPAAGEGQASPVEVALLARLRHHAQQLKRIDRKSADGWQRIAELLSQIDEHVSPAQVFRDSEQHRPS